MTDRSPDPTGARRIAATPVGTPGPDWYADVVLALVAWGAAFGMAVLHVVDVRRDLAQEELRLRDVRRFYQGGEFHGIARLVQDVGKVQFTVLLAVVVTAELLRRRSWDRAVAVAVATYVVVYLVSVSKLLIRHPAVATAGHHPIGSFPSGHTADLTAIVGVVLVAIFPLRYRLVPYAVAIGGGIVVGGTRVISGAHTPDDVVAGWLLGSALVLTAGAWLSARETRGGR